MRFLLVAILLGSFVGCSKKGSSGGNSVKAPVVEDILNQVYKYYVEGDSETVSKLEFFDNDTVKVTKADGSSQTLKSSITDEGEEDDADLLLSTLCSGTSSGDTSFVDLKLTNSDGSFASNFGAEVWEGTCNGEEVSCVAMVVYDVDPVEDDSTPVQAYIFGLNNENGCDQIQDEVESLLNSILDPI